MNNIQKAVILLIKSALFDKAEQMPDGVAIKDIIEVGKMHGIIPLLYFGTVKSEFGNDDEEKPIFENMAINGIILDRNQQNTINAVFSAFETGGIEFMPLKGSVLKRLYPKSEMRTMGDADILIKTEQYDKIKSVMTELGFAEKYETNHELVWKKDGVVIELHKRLIPSYNKEYYAYFGDGWRLAKPFDNGNCRYEMSAEDEFIYNFTHLAKHYRDGGIGLRHMLDLYVIRLKNDSLDFDYIRKELKKLHFSEFFANISQTLDVWFEGEEPTEKTDFITDYIFSSGSYGTMASRYISYTAKSANSTSTKVVKAKKIFSLIFPKYSDLSYSYPLLKKVPVLLPLMWVVRWFKILFFKREKIQIQGEHMREISPENLTGYRESLKYVGLDIK